MKPLPIVYVRDVDEARRFYSALGMTVRYVAGYDRGWVELEDGGAVLALHRLGPEPTEPALELTFVSDQPLDEVSSSLADAGYDVLTPVTDEAFGRSMKVRDPDGRQLQLNWFDPELRVAPSGNRDSL